MALSKKMMLMAGVGLGSLTLTTGAFANAFSFRGQSTVGYGEAFAGMAVGNGTAASMYWNPSTMTQFNNWLTYEGNSSLVMPNTTANGTLTANGFALPSTNSGNMGQTVVVPASYLIYRPTDKIALGLALNTPFASVVNPNEPWSGQNFNMMTKIFSFNITPMVAYQVTDTFSVGAGLQLQYIELTQLATTKVPPLQALTDFARVRAKGWDVGFTLGLNWKPVQGTEFGLGYRSAVKQTVKGDFQTFSTAGLPMGPALGLKSGFTLPDILTFSVSQVINPQWKLLASFQWFGWSKIGNPCINYDIDAAGCGVSTAVGGAIGLTPQQAAQIPKIVPFQFKDGYFASIGAEYRYNDQLTLRGGIGYDWSPVRGTGTPDTVTGVNRANQTVRAVFEPDGDRLWLSTGFSYQINETFRMNAGYSFVKIAKGDVNRYAGAGALNWTGTTQGNAHILSFGLTSTFGDAKPKPIQTKF